MNNFDDIVKKSFEDQSLENESWLEPSDSVLGAIHAEINQEDKKERKFSWIWPSGFLLLLIVLSVGVMNIFSQDEEKFSDKTNLELINLSSNNKNPKTTNAVILSSTIKESESIQSNPAVVKPEKNNDIDSNENPNPKFNVESVLSPSNNIESSSINQNKNKSKVIVSSDIQIDIPTILNINSNINQSLPIVSNEIKPTDNNISKQEGDVTKTKLINDDREFTELSYLENIQLELLALDIIAEEHQISSQIPYIAVKPIKKKKQTVVELNTGFLNWNDQLNTNYQAALSPADFENGSDFGFQVGLAIKKEVISKLSAGVRLSYSQIENRSGHNAVLAYDESQEINGQNNYESIQLATPYGFVNSNFNIKRSEAALEPNAILNSSINSKHQIRIASLESLLNYNLISLQKFSLNLEASLGYNHLIALNNDLDFINTNHDDFNFTNGEILVDQGNLKDGFWSTGLNVNLNYDLKPNASIGFNYGFRKALSPLFSSGDFSSSPNTHQFNFSVQRKF